MELMRKHSIRHLPVMATASGEDSALALQNVLTAAQRYEASARKNFNAYLPKLTDAFGSAEGGQIFDALKEAPAAFDSDSRPLVQRAGAAAAKLQLSVQRLEAVENQEDNLHNSFPVGVISIRDLLLATVSQQARRPRPSLALARLRSPSPAFAHPRPPSLAPSGDADARLAQRGEALAHRRARRLLGVSSGRARRG